MISELIQFAMAHPVAVLVGAGVLGGCWLLAAFISVMPPLPANSGWWITFAYRCAQIFGASLDKAGHAAAQTTAFRQVEQTIKTSDASGLVKTATAKTTEQTAEPQSGVPQ
jgi:hypothetical protein